MENTGPARKCVGCLDSRQCWVCEGAGHGLGPQLYAQCTRCSGTGACALCLTRLPKQRTADAAAATLL